VAPGAETATAIAEAIRGAAARGVAVRLAYDRTRPERKPTDPPPARTEERFVRSLGVAAHAFPGWPDLMHQKFIVRDGTDVWTGSPNWTDDSFSRQENLILFAHSPDLAAAYARDFEELWTRDDVAGTGDFEVGPFRVGTGSVRPWFCPGMGRRVVHRIAGRIDHARRRVRVCSPVITAGPILGTLSELASMQTVDLAVVCDATQMREVLAQWSSNPRTSWKVPAFLNLVERAPVSGKRSTPWSAHALHDFMHAKVTVADDAVFIGSYNLSRSGEDNAENVLEIIDQALADQMAAYIDSLRGRFATLGAADLDPGRSTMRPPPAPRP